LATYFSTLGSTFAKVPTAPEIAQVEIFFTALLSLILFLLNSSKKLANFKPKVVGSA